MKFCSAVIAALPVKEGEDSSISEDSDQDLGWTIGLTVAVIVVANLILVLMLIGVVIIRRKN